MCAVLRVLPTSICRYVTLNALRPRHLSRPLACVCAGELPCGCFELNRSTLHCYSANAALPWHDSSFFILHVYGHHYAVMVVWSLPIWQLWARLFFGQRQKEGEMEILKRRLNLVLIQLAVGGKKWNAICTLKIGHCLREDCSIQIMTLKRHWSESADRLSRKDITHMNRSFFTWL